jgi:hypothetical protein
MAKALIAAAQEESREELMELFARLLANAMDPNLNSVRQSFIEAVKKMDPLDAVVLRYIHENGVRILFHGGLPKPLTPLLENELTNHTAGTQNISGTIGCRVDEVEVSIRHLKALSLIDENLTSETEDEFSGLRDWWINATGREFLRACYPEYPATPC